MIFSHSKLLIYHGGWTLAEITKVNQNSQEVKLKVLEDSKCKEYFTISGKRVTVETVGREGYHDPLPPPLLSSINWVRLKI